MGSRYIFARCPVCKVDSPVCDQETDIWRQTISDWWFPHFDKHHRFGPDYYRADPPESEPSDGIANFDSTSATLDK